MTQLKTVQIKGKSYVEVKERLKYFRENYKDYSLESELVQMTDESVVFKAVIRNEQGRILATGFAQDYKNSSFINKTSYIENCETSAWGRCLGNFGIGIDSSVATFEEVKNAIQQQSKTKSVEDAVKKTFNAKPVESEKSLKPILTNEDETKWNKAIVYVFENSMAKLKEYYAISEELEKRLSLEVWSYMKTLAVEKGVDYVLERKEMSEEMQKELIDSIYSDYQEEEEEQYDTYLQHIAEEYHNNRG